MVQLLSREFKCNFTFSDKIDEGQLNFSPGIRDICTDTCNFINKFTVKCIPS